MLAKGKQISTQQPREIFRGPLPVKFITDFLRIQKLGIQRFLPRASDHSAGISIFLLYSPYEGNDRCSANELSTYFTQAFPAVINSEEGDPSSEESLQFAQHALYVRFIERFSEYFGLVTVEKGEKRSLQLDYLIRTTPFFDELFQWK